MESGGDAGRFFLPAGALYGDDNNQNLSSNNWAPCASGHWFFISCSTLEDCMERNIWIKQNVKLMLINFLQPVSTMSSQCSVTAMLEIYRLHDMLDLKFVWNET